MNFKQLLALEITCTIETFIFKLTIPLLELEVTSVSKETFTECIIAWLVYHTMVIVKEEG